MATKKKSAKEEYICQKCGMLFFGDSFIETKSPMYKNGIIPICKECINYYIKDKNILGGSIEVAIFYLCAITDTPCIREVLESCKEKDFKVVTRKKNYFELYMNKLDNMRLDNKWYEFSDSDIGLEEIKDTNVVAATIKQKEKNMELTWGKKKLDDYSFLEYRYEYWTSKLKELDITQETLYKDLCLTELKQRDLEEKGESTENIQKQKLSIMKTLKIDKIKEVKELTLEEKTLEKWIAIEENVNPADFFEDIEMFKDLLGIGNDNDMIMRSTKNLVVGSREYPELE